MRRVGDLLVRRREYEYIIGRLLIESAFNETRSGSFAYAAGILADSGLALFVWRSMVLHRPAMLIGRTGVTVAAIENFLTAAVRNVAPGVTVRFAEGDL